MIAPFRLGPLRFHWEVALVVAGLCALAGPSFGAAFLAVLALHELGHTSVALILGVRGPDPKAVLRLQLGSGASDLPEGSFSSKDGAVLLGGPALGLLGALVLAAALDERAPETASAVRTSAFVWSVFQMVPAPVTDLGALLTRVLQPRWGRLRLWWGGWGLGALSVLALVATGPEWLGVIGWLTGLAILLGRSEAAHVRHLEIYDAFEAERWSEVLRAARRAQLPAREGVAVAELGVHAALEMEDADGVAELLERLPTGRPLALDAARWLLQRNDARGAAYAERLHDRVDRGGAVASSIYAELAFYHAIQAARGHQHETALGLLERAATHGFDDRDRWCAEGAFEPFRNHPRYRRLTAEWELA